MLDRAAVAFDNPDWVEVVIHSCRHRLGLAPGHRADDDLERRLAAQPPITVPAVTLDGQADGNLPATDAGAQAAHFTGPAATARSPTPATTFPRKPRRLRHRDHGTGGSSIAIPRSLMLLTDSEHGTPERKEDQMGTVPTGGG